jgi:D-glycero-alpha-D-manno-heptose 1-phosphate guanylyltransferase
MEAIVLAGGFGTRLRQVVSDVPKPMAPVAGRPFLEILLSALARKGFRRVVLSLGHMADIVVGHFGASFAGIELVYEIEDTPLGTGGAIRAAMAHCRSDHVFVFNGDTFLDLEADQVETKWLAARRPIIVAREVPDTARYGRMRVEDGRVSGFLEKGVGGEGLINAGCYVFPRTLLDRFEPGHAFSLETAFLAPMAAEKCFDVFVTHGHFIDIGIPEDYARAQTELAGVA